MYFTDTPALNSIEAIMKTIPKNRQRGGGIYRSEYKYTKEDCDCRYCRYYRKRKCSAEPVCPVLDIRLGCGAASLYEAVQSVFGEVKNKALQRRLQKIYKDGDSMIFRNDLHKHLFEAEKSKLLKPKNQTLAVLYLLTSDHTLMSKVKGHLNGGKIDFEKVQIGSVSSKTYALWKAVKELQTGEKQISLCELADNTLISDDAFRLITQAMMVVRFGTAVLNAKEESHV